ncbi:helix-turn-helix transcriptional regulator [Nocardiopsis rhodophaea]|uniref:helix-turn-helix transcriptional regulator n=1 Tax=Nocardiopsis rhodophaea TaxID=280238 RepID=UPI0031D83500
MPVFDDHPRRPRVVILGRDHPDAPDTRILVEETARALRMEGAHTVDPAFDPTADSVLTRVLSGADAMVLATPLVHNSYSGRLKCLLDMLRPRQLGGMPVGLMATTVGDQGMPALDHLRAVVQSLDGRAIPIQVVATGADFAERAGMGRAAGPGLREHIREFCHELLWPLERRGHRGSASSAPAAGREPSRPDQAEMLRFSEYRSPLRVELPETGDGAAAPGHPGTLLADASCRGIVMAIGFIRENFTDPELSLDAAARAACMSRFHFSRTFKARTGCRYIDFVTRLRLARARRLLAETNDSVSAVCHASGFNDLSHFERTFKRRFAVSPSAYRARHRGQEMIAAR